MTFTPYTYFIGWSKHNLFYYGCRYARKCDPSDFWVSYFTSSKDVKNIVKTLGDPDIKKIRKTFKNKKDCLEWERKVLLRLKVTSRSDFLNKYIPGSPFKNDEGHTKETKEKISNSIRKYFSETDKNTIRKKYKYDEKSKWNEEQKAKHKELKSNVAWLTSPDLSVSKMFKKDSDEYSHLISQCGWIKGRKSFIPSNKGSKKEKLKESKEQKRIRLSTQAKSQWNSKTQEEKADWKAKVDKGRGLHH